MARIGQALGLGRSADRSVPRKATGIPHRGEFAGGLPDGIGMLQVNSIGSSDSTQVRLPVPGVYVGEFKGGKLSGQAQFPINQHGRAGLGAADASSPKLARRSGHVLLLLEFEVVIAVSINRFAAASAIVVVLVGDPVELVLLGFAGSQPVADGLFGGGLGRKLTVGLLVLSPSQPTPHRLLLGGQARQISIPSRLPFPPGQPAPH